MTWAYVAWLVMTCYHILMEEGSLDYLDEVVEYYDADAQGNKVTGTAAWMYIAVTQYMLGIRPTWEGLLVDPCLPEEMLSAKVTRVFRGKKYEINITKNEKMLIKAE